MNLKNVKEKHLTVSQHIKETFSVSQLCDQYKIPRLESKALGQDKPKRKLPALVLHHVNDQQQKANL